MVIVPLYDTLGADAASFIINQTNIELIVCDTQAKVATILPYVQINSISI
jgi:long-chain acyl-CoA synthetase